jgi:hypothetical protein
MGASVQISPASAAVRTHDDDDDAAGDRPGGRRTDGVDR